LNGLDLQTELAQVQIDIPIVFITGHGDIPMSVMVMKNGAVEFLTKLSRLAAGETQADVALTYNVDATTIGRLK
jgi:FixJ family two-component response regulator